MGYCSLVMCNTYIYNITDLTLYEHFSYITIFWVYTYVHTYVYEDAMLYMHTYIQHALVHRCNSELNNPSTGSNTFISIIRMAVTETSLQSTVGQPEAS